MFLAVAFSATALADEWVNVQPLERRIRGLERQGEIAERRIESMLTTVERSLLERSDARRLELEEKVEQWTQSIEDVSLKELGYSVRDALIIARQNGLRVDRLQRIHDLTKKIIRDGEFLVAAGEISEPNPPDDSLRYTNPVAYFNGLFQFVEDNGAWVAENESLHQEYRVRLYKRATVAFIRALVASEQPPPECDRPRETSESIEIGGRAFPLVGCPDPVVEGLRDYLDAIRRIQSADADVLVAEAEMLVARQQLAADIMAGVPALGEALDIYAIYSGENLAGRKLTEGEKVLTGLFLALPLVGPQAADAIHQGARRVPGFDTMATRVHEALVFVRGVVVEGANIYREVAQSAADDFARLLGESRYGVDHFDFEHLIAVLKGAPVDRAERFLHEAMSEVAEGKRIIAALENANPAAIARARAESRELLERVLKRRQAMRGMRIRASGMVDDHVDALLEIAEGHREIYIMRPVNLDAGDWLNQGARTKGMGIKPKSAAEGPISGLLPVDQGLNKLGSKIRRARAELADAATEVERRELAGQIQDLERQLAKSHDYMAKCLKEGCASKTVFRIDGREVMSTRVPGTDEVRFVMRDGDTWVDAQSRAALDFVPENPTPVEVLADADGNYITADYDLMAFGSRLEGEGARFTPDQGGLTPKMQERLDELNESVEEISGVPDRDVIHHGPDQFNPGTEGPDYPVTVLDGSTGVGEVITIPECDYHCMREWCSATGSCDPSRICGQAVQSGCVKVDPDRLLKDYFHDRRLASYDLAPNPRWNWGDYNGFSGWRHVEVEGSPEAAMAALRHTVQFGATTQAKAGIKKATGIGERPRGEDEGGR